MACFASTSVRPLTVLTENDGVPGSKIEKEPENYTVNYTQTLAEVQGFETKWKKEQNCTTCFRLFERA